MKSVSTLSQTNPRRLLALAALLVAASTPSLAADPQVQRLAMSCTSATHTVGCNNSPLSSHVASPARANHNAQSIKAVRAPAQSRKQLDAHSANDGSRFQYDSCGCSGS